MNLGVHNIRQDARDLTCSFTLFKKEKYPLQFQTLFPIKKDKIV